MNNIDVLAIRKTIKIIEYTLSLVFIEEKDLYSLDVENPELLAFSSNRNYSPLDTLLIFPSRVVKGRTEQFASSLKNFYSFSSTSSPKEMFLAIYLNDRNTITIGRFLSLEEII